jgi:hypothetical protein
MLSIEINIHNINSIDGVTLAGSGFGMPHSGNQGPVII